MRRPQPSVVAVPILALATLALGLAAAGCGGGTTPTASPGPGQSSSPTVAPSTPAPTALPTAALTPGPSASANTGSAPYDITIPTGWESFDLADPAAKVGLDAFVEANPNLAASIQAFESIPGVRMAVNPLLGDFMLVITTPSNGVGLDTLAQSFTAQFQLVPGLQGTPTPKNLTLPGGDAVHWDLKLTSNKPGGGTITAQESIYLFANSTDAVIVEFVTPAGGTIPDEQSIVSSFRFRS